MNIPPVRLWNPTYPNKWFPKIICGRFPLCLHIHSLLNSIDSFYIIHVELESEELELELQSLHYALKFMYIPFVGTIHTTVCILDIYKYGAFKTMLIHDNLHIYFSSI